MSPHPMEEQLRFHKNRKNQSGSLSLYAQVALVPELVLGKILVIMHTLTYALSVMAHNVK